MCCALAYSLPDPVIPSHGHIAHTVEGYHIKIAHGFVVLDGLPAATITHPSGIFWLPKVLHCKKLQHRRRKRLRHTVDLIDKQDSSRCPLSRILRYTLAMISLIVYSVTE